MTQAVSSRVLLVDDEQSLLDAFRRTHRKAFDLHTACGAQAGLEEMEREGPFAVVVSDYQMPGMNGIEFLAKICETSPETTRIMLTGNADRQSAIDAVNRGNVFRFLTKPCEREVFASCLDAALELYHLKYAERLLLEQTVRGSIEVLSDVLALASPEVFGRSTRVRSYVTQLAARLRLPTPWQYETAALLSQIGFIAIPSDVIEQLTSGKQLSEKDEQMVARHPAVAHELLCKIPRLEPIAAMIAHQRLRYADIKNADLGKDSAAGSQVLAVALAFDELISIGTERGDAIRLMEKDKGRFAPKLLDLLSEVELPGQDLAVRALPVDSLKPGMIIDQDVRSSSGTLIVARGNAVSPSMLQRLRNYADAGNIPACIRVLESEVDSEPRAA
jgi:response regulator RpfG family c-di-GMP phosphodiesterase